MNTTNWIKKLIPHLVGIILVSSVVFLFFLKINGSISNIQVKTFSVSDGWGYRIQVNNKNYIEQPFIPGENKKPFPSQKMAFKAGKLVKDKLKRKIAPNLTHEDLVKIGAIPRGD